MVVSAHFIAPTFQLAVALLVAIAFLVGACGFAESPPRCVMGQEHTLGKAQGLAFDDLALTTLGQSTYAFWSDAAGLHGAVLNGQGKVTQAPQRLAERCIGGIAAGAHKGSIALACLRPLRAVAAGEAVEVPEHARDDGSEDVEIPRPQSGEAVLLTLSSTLQLQRAQVLGDAGRLSHGVDLGVHKETLAVVWHDGALDTSRIWLWRGGDEAESLLLSSPLSIPSDPSLTWLDGRLWLMWSEAAREARNQEQRLVLSRGEGAPTVVTTVTHDNPTPRLRAHAGGLYLAFRDKRDRGRKPGLYVSRISERGALIGELARLSRADAKAGPAIVPCFGGLLAVAPRTFGGGKFVGVNWVDKTLTRSSQERQYYEDSRQFARAAGTCLNDHALLLIGEQGNSERPDVFLRTVGFRCE